MSDLVATGEDGVSRCAWAYGPHGGAHDYHDKIWGIPSHDPVYLFEILTLCGFAAGIRWTNVWRKRDGFRAAFRGYDLAVVAEMTEADVDHLMTDTTIIRNRRKIEATLGNAAAALALETPLHELVWEYAVAGRPSPRGREDFHATSAESHALAKSLQKAGFTWVGPVSVYAFMQTVGIVNDHIAGCYLAAST